MSIKPTAIVASSTLLLAILCMFTSFFAAAQSYSQSNVHIKRLGSHTGNYFYMDLKEGLSTNCKWTYLYCLASDDNCKNYYPILLAAKMADKPLAEIRYIQSEPNGSCMVNLVSIE